MNSLLKKSKEFDSHYEKNFDAYFNTVVEQELKDIEQLGQAYADVYSNHITSQEEDEEYIRGTMENIKRK